MSVSLGKQALVVTGSSERKDKDYELPKKPTALTDWQIWSRELIGGIDRDALASKGAAGRYRHW